MEQGVDLGLDAGELAVEYPPREVGDVHGMVHHRATGRQHGAGEPARWRGAMVGGTRRDDVANRAVARHLARREHRGRKRTGKAVISWTPA